LRFDDRHNPCISVERRLTMFHQFLVLIVFCLLRATHPRAAGPPEAFFQEDAVALQAAYGLFEAADDALQRDSRGVAMAWEALGSAGVV
jgi:hypothetical protein